MGNYDHPLDLWKAMLNVSWESIFDLTPHHLLKIKVQHTFYSTIDAARCRPGSRGPCVSAKGPKAIDAQSGRNDSTNARKRAGQLTALKQGPPDIKSVRLEGLTADVGLKEERRTAVSATWLASHEYAALLFMWSGESVHGRS